MEENKKSEIVGSTFFEFLTIDGDMQNLIRQGNAGVDALRTLARKKGMISLVESGLSKVLAGVTSLAEVMSVVA